MATKVVCNWVDSFGNPFPNACFKFTPTDPPYTNNQSLASANAKSIFTDTNGNFTCSLVAGNYAVLVTSRIKQGNWNNWECNNFNTNSVSQSYSPPNTNFFISVPSSSLAWNIKDIDVTNPYLSSPTVVLFLPVSASDARYLSVNSTASLYVTSASWASASISSSYSNIASTSINSLTASSLNFVPLNSTSASYSITSSFALNGGGSGTTLVTGSTYQITASNAISASWAPSTGGGTTLNTGSTYQITSSWANNSISASNAVSSSWSRVSLSSLSSSWASASISSSYASQALSASWAPTLSSGTTLVTGSTYQITSSWSNNSISASWSPVPVSASYAVTASYSNTASFSVNSISSLYSNTSSFVTDGSDFINLTSGVITIQNTELDSIILNNGNVSINNDSGDAIVIQSGMINLTADNLNVMNLSTALVECVVPLVLDAGATGSLFGTSSWSNNSISAISASFLTDNNGDSITLKNGITYNGNNLVTSSIFILPNTASNSVVLQTNTASFNSAFFNYSVSSGSNFRAGQIIGTFSPNTSNVFWNETVSGDVGNTSDLTMSMFITQSNVQLIARSNTFKNWKIKTIGSYL